MILINRAHVMADAILTINAKSTFLDVDEVCELIHILTMAYNREDESHFQNFLDAAINLINTECELTIHV